MFSLSDDSSEDEKEEEVVPAVVPLKTTAILRREREPTYANAVVQRQGCNSIDILCGPESGPSHFWSFETCLDL